MPAVSRSQQRLFGMVHAYNSGKFHGKGALKKRIAALADRISEEDAGHFARTSHEGIPEVKSAQIYITPDQARMMYSHIPEIDYGELAKSRSKNRRTLLGSVFRGGLTGAVVGGIGFGALGAYLASKAAGGKVSGDALRNKIIEAGIRTGILGATGGASTGALVGGGLYAFDKLRGGE